jgi:hypothetical protein
MPLRSPVHEQKQIIVGLLSLLLGSMIYLVDRSPSQTYFVSRFGSVITLSHVLPPLFGYLAGSLPAFIHVFAFALLTTGILACERKGCIAACVVWLSVDVGFELGQKFGVWSSSLVPVLVRQLYVERLNTKLNKEAKDALGQGRLLIWEYADY